MTNSFEQANSNNQVSDAPVWLITGASRGFGAEFAHVALEHGCRVAATARKPEAVEREFASCPTNENLLPVALDVTNIESVEQAVQTVINTWGRIDVLVNNAGYGIFGALEECSDAEARKIYDTNVFGMMNVTRAVLPYMREQHAGRIVSMGSMASFACDAGGALYDSTKFAVAGISEVLSLEMEPFGIEAMVVEPGMFRTNFFDGSSIKTPANEIAAYDGTPARGAMDYCLSHSYQQKGDPRKAAEFVYSVVADPRPMPWWLPVGKDAYKKFERKLQSMIDAVQPYKEAGSDLFVD